MQDDAAAHGAATRRGNQVAANEAHSGLTKARSKRLRAELAAPHQLSLRDVEAQQVLLRISTDDDGIHVFNAKLVMREVGCRQDEPQRSCRSSY